MNRDGVMTLGVNAVLTQEIEERIAVLGRLVS